MGALTGRGRLLDRLHTIGSTYKEGGAYWKEHAKLNHYGIKRLICFHRQSSSVLIKHLFSQCGPDDATELWYDLTRNISFDYYI